MNEYWLVGFFCNQGKEAASGKPTNQPTSHSRIIEGMTGTESGAAIAPEEADSLMGTSQFTEQPHNRGSTANLNLNFATDLTPETEALVDELFDYQPWTTSQVAAGRQVRIALADAYKAVIHNVPPCATRTTALRKIAEARMDANAAITHRGRF